MSINKKAMPGILGIDAGGTFTDLVFLSGEDSIIHAKAKTTTIHDDLILTITRGLDLILAQVEASAIRSFNIATTLATNAIVENKLRPAALILIGYDDDIVKKAIKQNAFNTKNIITVAGGHDNCGNEITPLDDEVLKAAIDNLPQNVESIAVSAYFSVRNAGHENRAVQIIEEMRPNIFVTCGHDLSTELNAIKRATTCVLNAGLIPIVMELLDSVEGVCKSKGIDVPITVVRGDGTLVGAQWAKTYPVEMILSGPAGSACGACFLANAAGEDRASWVVDIGGTTTDIIRLSENGKPVLLEKGATVAGHKTLVKAIDIHTFGLGGDSRVVFNNRAYDITLGNRRVRPLCSMASEYPEILEELRLLKKKKYLGEPIFLIKKEGRPANTFEREIMEQLEDGPRSRSEALAGKRLLSICYRQIEEMYDNGLVDYVSFTPTDALHVLGLLDLWDRNAAVLGAELMIDGTKHHSAKEIAEEVRDLAVKTIGEALFYKSFAINGMTLSSNGEGKQIIDYALTHDNEFARQIQLRLNAMLVGVGAPSWAFVPLVGDDLNEMAVLPENADVAGAVGAAVGSFSLVYSVKIIPSSENANYRVHYPLGIADYDTLEEAEDFVCKFMIPWLTERATRAGAHDPKVSWQCHDERVPLYGMDNVLHLWTQMSFTVSD